MNWLEEEKKYFLPVFNRIPVEVVRGQGVYLYDRTGKAYLDLLAGIAVNALGYNHPSVNKAIRKQAERNLHLSNYFVQDIQIELASSLLALTPFSKLFFTNSGTEAIEGLLKLVKKWAILHEKSEIIAFEGSFHGRSLGALSITIQNKYQKNFLPLLANVRYVPFNDRSALEAILSDKTAAIFYEGIAGEGGIRPLSQDVISVIKDKRKKYGFLAIQDEIQTGVARTGKFYHFEHLDIIPDAIATAKGLGGGLPLGAFLVSEELSTIFDKGEHGTTYGGNPLACAAGLAVIKITSSKEFLETVTHAGNQFKAKLHKLAEQYPEIIHEIRGLGLMLGLEVKSHAKELMSKAVHNGLIFNIAGESTLRFVPPLILNDSQIMEACEKLEQTFKDIF